MLNLNDFTERTGVRLPAGPYETVGGFIMSTLGRLPNAGDEVTWQPHADESYQLNVLALEGRRVARVRIGVRPPEVAAVAAAAVRPDPEPRPEPAAG
jgi:putative hemolysin